MSSSTEAPQQGTIPDEDLERQVAERRAKREQKAEGVGDEPREGRDLIKSLADGEEVTTEEVADATEWFLTAEETAFTHTIRLNVGNPSAEKWIDWTIRPVDMETLRRIRKQSQGGSRAAQRRAQATGEMDEVEANLRIVAEGTVDPDLKAIAKQLRMVDPSDALRQRFAHKPGLVGQISGEIMSISGYDDEDVREVDAAGNS